MSTNDETAERDLRDRLAMAALAAFTFGGMDFEYSPENVVRNLRPEAARAAAESSYAIADAMLEARKVTP
jgi:hypothetical protein